MLTILKFQMTAVKFFLSKITILNITKRNLDLEV